MAPSANRAAGTGARGVGRGRVVRVRRQAIAEERGYRRGATRYGYYADFVALSADIIDEPESITSAKVVKTFLEGDCVYER